jgi:hypothetical protein
MTEKLRVRIQANDAAGVTARVTRDSFQNFAARVGIGTDNLSSHSTYGFNPITRLPIMLEWMYRGSWIVRKCVDAVAEDMTKAGVTFGSALKADAVDGMQASLNDLGVWQGLGETIKWGRMYGGALAVIQIDGQRNSTPLRLDTVAKGQFIGLAVLDRWMVSPSLNDLIRSGADAGKPKFYDVTVEGAPLPRQRIHHSRVVRIDGIDLPWRQRITENGWGLSVIEPLYDRLIAFDSTTQGAAQLVFKAHLRTLKVPRLREIIATGGKTLEGLLAQVEMMRRMQANEGVSLLDGDDTFEAHQYTFSGLDQVLLQFGQQLSGAMDIPLVRLFGQSPAGLNSSGESDLRTYYDGLTREQGSRLRRPLTKILDVVHRSTFGAPAPDGFTFDFAPLWEMSDEQKSGISKTATEAVTSAYEAALIDKPTALRELRASAKVGSMWSSITDDVITEAENEPPPAGEMGDDVPGLPGAPGADPQQAQQPQAGPDPKAPPHKAPAPEPAHEFGPLRTAT